MRPTSRHSSRKRFFTGSTVLLLAVLLAFTQIASANPNNHHFFGSYTPNGSAFCAGSASYRPIEASSPGAGGNIKYTGSALGRLTSNTYCYQAGNSTALPAGFHKVRLKLRRGNWHLCASGSYQTSYYATTAWTRTNTLYPNQSQNCAISHRFRTHTTAQLYLFGVGWKTGGNSSGLSS